MTVRLAGIWEMQKWPMECERTALKSFSCSKKQCLQTSSPATCPFCHILMPQREEILWSPEYQTAYCCQSKRKHTLERRLWSKAENLILFYCLMLPSINLWIQAVHFLPHSRTCSMHSLLSSTHHVMFLPRIFQVRLPSFQGLVQVKCLPGSFHCSLPSLISYCACALKTVACLGPSCNHIPTVPAHALWWRSRWK